jgi:glycosyltransferase involved in cell wall biosynthesis
MNYPTVSVLIPVYNRESLITETVQSVLNQTYQDFEIIIVDNASTDNTWEVCKQLAKKDLRIKIWQNDINIGPVLNWKKCIEKAQGEYGKILFSDDLIQPTFLEKTIPFLEDSQIGFVFTAAEIGINYENKQNRIEYKWRNGKTESKEYFQSLLVAQIVLPVSPCAALFRLKDLKKNILTEIPSPTLQNFSAHGAGIDLLIYLLTAHQYPYIAHVNEPLVFFRKSYNSITMTSKANFIRSCYLQAKIWFANNYLSRKEIAVLVIRSWLLYCLREKNISFKKYWNFYGSDFNINFIEWIFFIFIIIKYLLFGFINMISHSKFKFSARDY